MFFEKTLHERRTKPRNLLANLRWQKVLEFEISASTEPVYEINRGASRLWIPRFDSYRENGSSVLLPSENAPTFPVAPDNHR